MDMHWSTQRQIKITDNKQQTYQQAEHSGTLMERCRGNVTFRRRNYFFPVCVVFTVIHPGHVVCSQSGPDQMLGGSRCIESLHISYFRISGQKRDVVWIYLKSKLESTRMWKQVCFTHGSMTPPHKKRKLHAFTVSNNFPYKHLS